MSKSRFWRRFAECATVFALLGATAFDAMALEADAVFEKVSASVWGVLTVDAKGQPLSRGSAVVIGAGRLVTNCHVLAKASSFVVRRENVAYGATLEYPDVERDLCQIKVANFTAPAVEMADVARLKVGSKVYAIGNPRGLEVTLSDGLVSGLRRTEAGALEMIQTSAPVSDGSSGGGLFDTDGRLVGITSFILRDSQNLNFALPVSQVAELETRGKSALEQRTTAPSLLGSTPAQTGLLKDAPALGHASPGDVFEYSVLDRLTRKTARVTYTVSRLEGDRVIYADSRIETPDGEILQSPPGSELDHLTPPRGWIRSGATAPGVRRMRFKSTSTGEYEHEYDLTLTTSEAAVMTTPAGQFNAVRIAMRGWLTERRVPSPTRIATAYRGFVWIDADSGRVIRVEADAASFNAFRRVGETVELVRIGRN